MPPSALRSALPSMLPRAPSVPIKRRVLRLFRAHSLAILVLVPLALVEVALDGGLTLSYKFLIDNAIGPGNGRALVMILGGLAVGVVVASCLSLFRDLLVARTVTAIVNDVRSATFDHCQRLSIGFYSRNQVGDLMARFATDLASLESWLQSAVNALLLPAMGILVGTSLLFFVLDWHLALFGTLVWPLVLLGPRLIAPRAADATYRKKRREAAMLATIEESLQAHRVIKSYGLQAFSRALFVGGLTGFTKSAVRAGFLSSLVERTTVASIYGVQVTVVALGAFMAYNRQVSVGSLVSFLTIFWNLGWSLVVIGRSAPGFVGAATSMRRIDELLNEEPDPSEGDGGVDLPPFRESMRFEDVTFGYQKGAPVLRGLDLEIRRGQAVAFVGPSGSGKSTVFNLLARFYDPQSGRILIDGVDVRTATAGSLRDQMGIVLQESFLFNTTLRENIRLGNVNATDEEVESAAKSAEIHDLVLAMPKGYDTLAGERGSRLSGGQRQRVALARALLRNAPILLLDEASSALDPATEMAINETLAKAARGRTTISITHRLATVMNSDTIFVVDKGRLVEKGSHADLVKLGGVYAELWNKQNGFVVSDDGLRAEVTAERLRGISLLKPLRTGQLETLAGYFVCERALAGQVVIREGDVGSLFYLIARGSVSVTRQPAARDQGEAGASYEIARLADGDQFGEMALLYDMPRSATVTTTTDCLFLTLTRHHFLDLIGTTPDVRATVERIAAERIARG